MRRQVMHAFIVVPGKISSSWPFDFDATGSKIRELASTEGRRNCLFESKDCNSL
jgi:hypothetical protein